MTISGQFFIGHERVGASSTFRAVNPATGETLEPDFSSADQESVDRACRLAWGRSINSVSWTARYGRDSWKRSRSRSWL